MASCSPVPHGTRGSDMSEKTIKADHVVESYRSYKIVAGKQKGERKGVVWDGGEQVHTCSAASLEDAMREMKDFVDQNHDERLMSRTTPPSGEEYMSMHSERYCTTLRTTTWLC